MKTSGRFFLTVLVATMANTQLFSGSFNELYNAIESANFDEVKRLVIEEEYDLNDENDDGDAPLHVAALQGHTEIVKFLMLKGANVNSKNPEGDTPLHLALREGHLEIARSIIFAGGDPSIKNNRHNNNYKTALDIAKDKEFQEIILLIPLIDQLFEATKSGKLSDVKHLIIEKELDINCKDHHPHSLLDYAFIKNNIALITWLIASGANINSHNYSGNTLLHRAVFNRNIEMVDFIILKGADVNSQNYDGNTPLHRSIEYGNLEIARRIIFGGGDPSIENNNNETALDIAAQKGFQGIIEFLNMVEQLKEKMSSSNKDLAIQEIFTEKGTWLKDDETWIKDKQNKFEILLSLCDIPALISLFELGKTTQGLLSGLFSQEMQAYEDIYKKKICIKLLNKPYLLKQYIIGNYFHNSIIYDHYSDKDTINEIPTVCLEIINELKKKQMLNVIVAQRKGSNLFFNFK